MVSLTLPSSIYAALCLSNRQLFFLEDVAKQIPTCICVSELCADFTNDICQERKKKNVVGTFFS